MTQAHRRRCPLNNYSIRVSSVPTTNELVASDYYQYSGCYSVAVWSTAYTAQKALEL